MPQDTQGTQLSISKNLRILLENSARGLSSGRKRFWGYVSVFDNTHKKLILKSIVPLKVAATLLSGSRKGAVGA